MAIVTTDRREYVDGRDEILGPPTTRPVIVAFALEELRICLLYTSSRTESATSATLTGA